MWAISPKKSLRINKQCVLLAFIDNPQAINHFGL